MKRGRREIETNNHLKYFIYLSGGVLIAIVLTFVITIIVYNNNLKEANYSALSTEQIAELVPNSDEYLAQINEELETASSDIGKNIEEAINSMENNEIKTNEVATNNTIQNEVAQVKKEEPEVVKDPEFIKPVEGDITRNYAKDTLIYSETLEEWIVHLGIDIKADRTTVVKAAEAGTVTSIKNDPRYGLTVVIEHVNGFKTVYSNLLTTEFVTEGEKVDKGQSIGTVGNSAAFEIVDEPHLHFEILKLNENIDPNIYLN